MDCFLLFTLLFAILPFTIQETVEKGGCKCAVFSESAQIPKSIIERAVPYNVTCDDEGEESCVHLCIALNILIKFSGKKLGYSYDINYEESAKEEAPHMICEKLNSYVKNLQVAVYAKVCNATSWKYTGLKGTNPICCFEGQSITCDELALVVES